MERIGVVGAGTMGSGIAQVLAIKGFQVLLHDIDQEALLKGIGRIKKQLERSVEKEKISADEKDKALERIKGITVLDELDSVQLVIEAAAEDMEVKKSLFKKLQEICPEDVILATNTSSLSISQIARATDRQDKVVGMHFFNPVPVMKLVEIIKGEKTSRDTVKKVKVLSENMGKRPVEVKDSPGFVVNRLLIPMINEAAILYEQGVAGAEAIDKGMELGANHPIGPLALADLIGLDVCLAIMETLHQDLKDHKYRPAAILKDKVAKGELGRKSQQGFYNYG